MAPTTQLVLGVDAASVGKRKGWAVVAATWDGADLGPASRPVFVERLDALVGPGARRLGGLTGEVLAVGIDIPIGLAPRGWRAPDLAGRRALGRRASTLFPMAPRAVVEEPDYARASALSRELTGKGVSKQSHGLRRRVLELDTLLRDAPTPEHPSWLEVHPELSFLALAREVVAEPKKTWAGLERRRRLLADVGLLPPAGLDEAARLVADDVLDAAVACWSAARALRGTATRYAACPPDCSGCGGGGCATEDPELARELVILA